MLSTRENLEQYRCCTPRIEHFESSTLTIMQKDDSTDGDAIYRDVSQFIRHVEVEIFLFHGSVSFRHIRHVK